MEGALKAIGLLFIGVAVLVYRFFELAAAIRLVGGKDEDSTVQKGG